MTNLISQFLDATDCRQVDRIVENNILKIDPTQRQHLCHFANRAKMRIQRISRMKKETWKELMN